jgi:hypothetical protein
MMCSKGQEYLCGAYFSRVIYKPQLPRQSPVHHQYTYLPLLKNSRLYLPDEQPGRTLHVTFAA